MYKSVYAVVVCPSVSPSVTSRYCIETTARIHLVLARRLLDISYTIQ